MIPLRDNLHSGGAPLFAAGLTLVMLIAGTALPGGGVWIGLLSALGAWIWSPSLVRERGAALTLLLAAAGAAVGFALAHSTQTDAGGPAVAAAAATLALAHLCSHPKAKVLVLIALPLRTGLAEIPSGAVAAVWAVPLALIATGG